MLSASRKELPQKLFDAPTLRRTRRDRTLHMQEPIKPNIYGTGYGTDDKETAEKLFDLRHE